MAVTCCASCMLLMLLILAAANTQPSQRTKKVFDVSCDQNSESQRDCQNKSLETVAATVQENTYTDVQINVKIPQLHLKSTVNFTNLKTLTISGEPTPTTIICTAGDSHSAGIVLDNITDTVTLNNLRQTFCGSRVIVNFDRIYDETYSKILSSALTIVHCHDMELEELIIERSRGNGLTIFNLQGGRVYIKSSIFIDNELPSEYINATEPVYGGSGVCILLGKFLQGQYSPMTIQFDNCTFRNNTAHTEHYNLGQT